jgi:energy-coupling factor transport system permease protein
MRSFNIPVGTYFPGDSLAHRLDPRIKIGLVLVYVLSVFAVQNVMGLVVYSALLIGTIVLLGLPASWFIKSLRPLRYILVIAFFIHVVFTSSGRILFSIGSLNIVDQGLLNGTMICLRLVLLVAGTSILTLTTTPIELTDGLEYLLGPLRALKIPTHELAIMMTLAMRFIPLLVIETERIMKAQMARGADFESGNVVRRAKSFVPLFIPLFVSILKRAEELALAMDSRCYRGPQGRTRMRRLEIKLIDKLALIVCPVMFVGLIFLGRL